jgi:cyclopropane fatty-acyl-phospholipid synthase-like methyltransferase
MIKKQYAMLALLLVGVQNNAFAEKAPPNTHEEPAMIHHHGDKHNDGGYHHRFQNAAEWAKKFDQPERETWQKPEQILDALKLPANALVGDVGAGTGYFTVRIAKRVSQGKVFAADLESDMVSYLGERAKRENLNNIIPVQASAESPNLPEPVDVLLLVDTYHHIGNRVEYFTKLNNSLKADGRLVLVDFRMDSPDGPPKEYRLSIEKVTDELKAAGYKLTENYDFLPRQYFIVFQKIAK